MNFDSTKKVLKGFTFKSQTAKYLQLFVLLSISFDNFKALHYSNNNYISIKD